MSANESLTTIAALLVSELGAGWSIAPDDAYDMRTAHRLIGPGERKLYLSVGTYGKDAGRLEISGAYPRRDGYGGDFVPHNEHRPTITVSTDRPAPAVVKDILRRFIPAYEALYALCAARAADHDAYTDRKGAHKARLVEAGWSTGTGAGDRVWAPQNTPGYVSGEITGDGIRLDSFFCTIDQAIAIVALLRQAIS